MKLSIGDVVDRWSIANLKQERGKIDTTQEQWDYLEYCQANYKYDIIVEYFKKLLDINGSIWSLESDIRQGKEQELGLEEVGRRAIKIREFNKQRIKFKNELNLKFNEGYQEVKINHGSE